MTTTYELTSAHLYEYNDENGDIVDVEYFCSDWCHRHWCSDTGHEYQGWNGCHEVDAPRYCTCCEAEI
jgi:hypothetical protein